MEERVPRDHPLRYMRQREKLVASASTCTQHIQKALTEMNIQLANVISDISGMTGMAILRAIVSGERNPQTLARLKGERIHATREEITQNLEGTWRPELLFVLEQSLALYDSGLARRHFHEKLRDEHDIQLSYTWVQKALQGQSPNSRFLVRVDPQLVRFWEFDRVLVLSHRVDFSHALTEALELALGEPLHSSVSDV